MFATKKPQSFVIEDGEYEAVIESITEKVNSNGKRYIEVACRIREGQPHARMSIYRKIWAAKTPSEDDVAVGGYLSWQVFEMADAAAIPEGKQFATLDDLFREVECRPVIVSVENQEYNGKSYAGVTGMRATERPLSDDERRIITATVEQNRRAREYVKTQKPAAAPAVPAAPAPRYETKAYTPPAPASQPAARPVTQTSMTPQFTPMEDPDTDKVPF